jgi:hypothetical protein
MADEQNGYVSIGTSTPIFIRSEFSSEPVRLGTDYFCIRICGAQVAFVGSIWSKVRSLLVSTKVNLHHAMLGERGLRSLQQSRAVKERVDEQLGLAVNLVDLTPAVMPQINLSVDFHLDKENRLAKLGSLVNKESFAAALSLAPGSAAVAKVVSSLADDIIQSFIPAEEQEPILQFTGDFNLATGGLLPGYYAILGSRDKDHPIPSKLNTLDVRDNRLFLEGRPLSGVSYVIIEVRKTSARSRDLGMGTEWDNRLREAEEAAQGLVDDPFANNEARHDGWTKCKALIKEAQTFLRAEPNYLRAEAELIVKATYLRCRECVTEPVLERSRGTRRGAVGNVWLPDEISDRQFLEIGAGDDLEREASAYASEIIQTRETLSDWAPHD